MGQIQIYDIRPEQRLSEFESDLEQLQWWNNFKIISISFKIKTIKNKYNPKNIKKLLSLKQKKR
jgi:hypothetical protein